MKEKENKQTEKRVWQSLYSELFVPPPFYSHQKPPKFYALQANLKSYYCIQGGFTQDIETLLVILLR